MAKHREVSDIVWCAEGNPDIWPGRETELFGARVELDGAADCVAVHGVGSGAPTVGDRERASEVSSDAFARDDGRSRSVRDGDSACGKCSERETDRVGGDR